MLVADQLIEGNEKIGLKEIGYCQWMMQCPFCSSSYKILVTTDIDSNGRKSINCRKSHFDTHLRSVIGSIQLQQIDKNVQSDLRDIK